LTNRTGPRVRILLNDYQTENQFLSLRLIGTRSNRDALGARVEVYLRGEPQPLIRTVYGGSGYISQSSKWLHFGLGADGDIERVRVRWPGAEWEEFVGIGPNRKYELRQDHGVGSPVEQILSGPWPTTRASEPPLPATDRVALLRPAPLPDELRVTDWDGRSTPLGTPRENSRGMVINLWATWCTNCAQEIQAWSAAQDRLSAAGLDVVSVCVEGTDNHSAEERARIRKFASRQQLPFEIVIGDTQLVSLLNVLQRAFIGRQTDLPLPASFLVDNQRRVHVIYKGPVHVDQLIRDAALLSLDGQDRFSAAVPFSGQWLERPPVTVPRMAAMAMIEHGYRNEAERYARQLLTEYSRRCGLDREASRPRELPTAEQQPEQDATACQEASSLNHLIGAIRFDQGDYQVARDCYAEAVRMLPSNRPARRELARTLLRTQDHAAAAEQLEHLLQEQSRDAELLADLARVRTKLGAIQPALDAFTQALEVRDDPAVRFEMANLLRDSERYVEAIRCYREVLERAPTPAVLNNLAWVLATAKDSGARNGVEARALAEQACARTDWKEPRILGTLAAACAEAGDAIMAVKYARQALEILPPEPSVIRMDLESRLREYEQQARTRDASKSSSHHVVPPNGPGSSHEQVASLARS
jgi:tetratricopeptide (TPR) repeat protein/peroxiredoxin